MTTDITLFLHIVGGGLALATGFVALCVRKGSPVHVRSGQGFVLAMLLMASAGAVLAVGAGKPFDALSSVMAAYMVLSGGFAFTQLSDTQNHMIICLGGLCLIGYVGVEVWALFTGVRSTDAPTGAGYLFATVLALALSGDLRSSTNGNRKRLLVRHLWRMNFGLLVATLSFFGARPHLFPLWMQSYGVLLLLSFLPLITMLFWRFKLRTA